MRDDAQGQGNGYATLARSLNSGKCVRNRGVLFRPITSRAVLYRVGSSRAAKGAQPFRPVGYCDAAAESKLGLAYSRDAEARTRQRRALRLSIEGWHSRRD